jgi:hypothetical protein
MGMRKDFIRSEEENQRRRKRIELNRNKTTSSLNVLSNLHTTEQIDQVNFYFLKLTLNY